MTEPQSAPTPPKKKLSALAWVAISCGGLIVVAAVLFAIGGAFLFSKGKQMVGDFEKNPAMAAAEMFVRANPDLELVESDPDAGTLTIREVKTGKEVTVDLEDIQEGKLSFKQGDQESTIRVGTGGGDEGVLTVTDEKGETTFKAGAGSAAEIPDWVPLYPGSTPSGTYRMSSGGETTGAFGMNTSDSVEEVLEYYGAKVEALGGSIQRSTFSTPDSEGGIVNGGTSDEKRRLGVTVNRRDGETAITVTYAEKS